MHKRLILFFNGWGVSAESLALEPVDGYDMAVVDGFCRDMRNVGVEEIADYDEIVVVAWSYGVVAASIFLAAHPELPVTLRLAVNGTMHPIDDRRGISPEIFHGTLNALDERNLRKFCRRVGQGANPAAKSIEVLKDELRAVEAARVNDNVRWDRAVVGSSDRIIPSENQCRAWQAVGVTTQVVADGQHMLDFNSLMRRYIIDKHRVGTAFAAAATTYDSHAIVQQTIARRLASLLGDTPRSIVVEAGSGTGYFSRLVAERLKPESMTLVDLSPTPTDIRGAHAVCDDAEHYVATLDEGSVDAVVSSSVLQWFNSAAAFIGRACRALRKGGVLALSTFAPDNFPELHPYITSLPYLSVEALRRAVPTGCSVEVLEEESMTLNFDSSAALLRHFSLTGVNALPTRPTVAITRRLLRQLRPDEASGRYTLTYRPIYMIVKK